MLKTNNRVIRIIFTAILAALLAGVTVDAKSIGKKIEIEWLGHGTILITSIKGTKILIDPWISTNPSCPGKYKDYKVLEGLDLVLYTHGHVDHFMLKDAQAVVEKYNPKVIAQWELSFLIKKYIPQVDIQTFVLGNMGSWSQYNGLKIAMVGALHSSGAQMTGMDNTDNAYSGTSVGYMLEFENGYRLYHSGDTGLMSDFKLVIGDFYRPDIAILPIGSVFTLGPEEAAYACKMMSISDVIPIHYKSFPVLTQDAGKLRQYLKKYNSQTKIHILEPGKARSFNADKVKNDF